MLDCVEKDLQNLSFRNGSITEFLASAGSADRSSVNEVIAKVLRYNNNQEPVLGWLQGIYDPSVIDRFTEFSRGKIPMNFKEMQKFIAGLRDKWVGR